MMSLTFSLFTQVSGSGPLGPLVFLNPPLPDIANLSTKYFILIEILTDEGGIK